MIKLRTMIPIVTALTLSTTALPSCDPIRPAQGNNTELLNQKAETDSFEKEGHLDKGFAAKSILAVFGAIATIFVLNAIKNPKEFKKHFLNKHDEEKPNQ